jgi:hypothetical protein
MFGAVPADAAQPSGRVMLILDDVIGIFIIMGTTYIYRVNALQATT